MTAPIPPSLELTSDGFSLTEEAAGLAHGAFVETLGGLSETDARWHRTLAGFLTMRAVDAWFARAGGGQSPRQVGRHHHAGARRAISAIGVGAPARALLSQIVDALAATLPASLRTVLTPLLHYGRALEFDAEWPLAIDVYGTVLHEAICNRDGSSAAQAALRLGYANRMLAQHDEAEAWYGRAGELAAAARDVAAQLLSQIGIAKVAMERGNYARARVLLGETVRQAEAVENRAVRASALHELSDLAFRNGEHGTALQLLHEALAGYRNQVDRDRALNDLAVNFAELGMLDAARDAYLVVLATAQEQTIRWVAMTNLLELAGRQSDRAAVEEYRQRLAMAALPPALEFAFWSQLGHAHVHLGDVPAAQAAFTTALRAAESHGLHGRVFETERRLAELAHGPPVAARTRTAAPAEAVEIAGAVRELREAVCGSK